MKLSLLARDKVCMSRTARGLNILDITIWNKGHLIGEVGRLLLYKRKTELFRTLHPLRLHEWYKRY
ncbi:hypothetical protein H5410_047779 [Solanum commersonii]|uniref:Uncharacterized protein n=1 Tax=Solanum commersonii TaxID=4109 RepID=A0A9J5XG53_SOLCO|nr:hypothetical protein H5410_047779 [Solanum commersonii]